MYIKATVTADGSKDSLTLKNGRYHITVRAPAQGGQANDAVRALLAEAFGVPHNKISLIKGSTQPAKIFLLRE